MRCSLILGFFLACLLLVSTVYALPPDTPIYWTDDFSKDDVYAQTTIFNANWTYTQTPNFTETVSYGILSIKYCTVSGSPYQWFKLWRGISKNEKGIQLQWKISKSQSDTMQLGLSDDGLTLKYFVEFGWVSGQNAIRVGFMNESGLLEFSDVLGSYQLGSWYWVELTYTSPIMLNVKVWKDGDSKNVYTFNATELRHEAAELWATGIHIYAGSATSKTAFFYVDYASFQAPGVSLGDITKIALDTAKVMMMLVMVVFAVSIFSKGEKE